MNIIFLYGPPGVGKLTVARELSKQTGYRLFHNHLTRDAVHALFEPSDPEFDPLVMKLRVNLLEAAASANLPGVVFTFFYAKDEDDTLIDAFCDAVEKHGGTIKFVQLTCENEELRRRVIHPSRKESQKISDLGKFDWLANRCDMFSSVNHKPNFVLDTTSNTPEQSAALIREHYDLPRIQ